MGRITCMYCGEEVGARGHTCVGKESFKKIESELPNKQEILNAITNGVSYAVERVIFTILRKR